jgi:hypothetical protein
MAQQIVHELMKLLELTICLSRANLAASAGQEDGVAARRGWALGLDVLAANATHDATLLVDLKS